VWGRSTARSFDGGPAHRISSARSRASARAGHAGYRGTGFTWTNGAPATKATRAKAGVAVAGVNGGSSSQ